MSARCDAPPPTASAASSESETTPDPRDASRSSTHPPKAPDPSSPTPSGKTAPAHWSSPPSDRPANRHALLLQSPIKTYIAPSTYGRRRRPTVTYLPDSCPTTRRPSARMRPRLHKCPRRVLQYQYSQCVSPVARQTHHAPRPAVSWTRQRCTDNRASREAANVTRTFHGLPASIGFQIKTRTARSANVVPDSDNVPDILSSAHRTLPRTHAMRKGPARSDEQLAQAGRALYLTTVR